MKILTRKFWKSMLGQPAAAIEAATVLPLPIVAGITTPPPSAYLAPEISLPPPTPAKTAVKPAATTPPPTTPTKPVTAAPVPTTKAPPAIKTLTRADFDKLSDADKAKHFRAGGKLIDNPPPTLKDSARAGVARMGGAGRDLYDVARCLMRGYALTPEDAGELLAEVNQANVLEHLRSTPDQMKAMLERAATDESRPLGYMLPDGVKAGKGTAEEIRDSYGISDSFVNGKPVTTGYARPGEVPEPERRAAEEKLCAMLAEFTALSPDMLKRVYWDNRKEEIINNAKRETRRSHHWVGEFVSQLPHQNAHIIS